MRNQEQHVCSECKARRHVFTLDPNNYATNGPRHNKRAPGASQACGLPLSPTTVAVVVVVARLLALSPLFLHPPLSLLSPRPQLPFLLFPVYSTVPCHALRFPYIPRATPFFFFPFPFPCRFTYCASPLFGRDLRICPVLEQMRDGHAPPTPCLLYLHLLAPWSVLMHASLVSHK